MPTPELPEWDDRVERALLMPFTEVMSKGGKYDDEAFTAGFQMGSLFELLRDRPILVGSTIIYSSLVMQADLIAMHCGYTTENLHDDGEWTQLGFTRIDP